MSSDSGATPPPGGEPDQLPFVAPCRELATGAAFGWLRQGWRDLKSAPRQSLCYGAAVVVASYLASLIAWKLGGVWLLLAMASGFLLVGPLMAIGVYEISRQLERGTSPTLAEGIRETRQHVGNALVYAIVVLVVFLVWARAASMVHIFFPMETNHTWRDMLPFLGIGSAVGAIFAGIIFAASAFSLPMIADRKTDTVTAVVTSVNAVLRNKIPMIVWGVTVVACILLGFATAFLGLAVLIPLLGHATYHGYRETIDASAWPPAD
ncbi:MAG: DUF2189 domain-containing protein [Gammaproteobacteria bacterium]|jgi:uncharacterized membrane protein